MLIDGPPPVPYLAIYRANMPAVPDGQAIILTADLDLHASLVSRPISFTYTRALQVFGPGTAALYPTDFPVQLPQATYILVQTSAGSDDFRTSFTGAALRVGEFASLISLRYPHILVEKMYEGAVSTPNIQTLIGFGPIQLTAAQPVDPTILAGELHLDQQLLDSLPFDRRNRYQLAARWYRRGDEEVNPIDKLFYWYTVLEIFPAERTSDVPGVTSKFLREKLYPELPPEVVKTKLELGRIAGKRSEVVHNGQAFIMPDDEIQISQYVVRLRAIAATCMRILAGMPPGNDLDEWVRA